MSRSLRPRLDHHDRPPCQTPTRTAHARAPALSASSRIDGITPPFTRDTPSLDTSSSYMRARREPEGCPTYSDGPVLDGTRVQVNAKAGPFTCMLCVGPLFAEGDNAELQPYLDGTKQVPLPTYFIDGLPHGRCDHIPRAWLPSYRATLVFGTRRVALVWCDAWGVTMCMGTRSRCGVRAFPMGSAAPRNLERTTGFRVRVLGVVEQGAEVEECRVM